MTPTDPKRIPELLAQLKALWLTQPQLRLGQLLLSATGGAAALSPLFYTEDDQLIQSVARSLKKG